tara:strand:+ start:4698 stop:5012 length:315 start_codon:yes stop_codon:yes gene_type:complete
MKTNKNLFLSFILLSSTFIFFACSSSSGGGSIDDLTSCKEAKVTAASKVIGDAAIVYNSDQNSSVKCNTYRTAINDYISLAENCPGNEAEIKRLKVILLSLTCS